MVFKFCKYLVIKLLNLIHYIINLSLIYRNKNKS